MIHELSRTAERVQGSWLGRPSDTSFVSRAAVWLEVHTGINGSSLENLLSETARTVAASITGTTLSLVGGTIGAVFQFFFVIITMYYLFRDGDQIVETVRQYLPMEDKQSKALIVRAKEVIGASVYGVIAIAALQGTLGGLAFWILGIPSALLWGVVMDVVSMIPVAGAWVVWIPAVIYLAGIGSWEKAIALGLWGALFISTIDNFLRPRIVGRRTHLHELLVFFGVLGGLRMFGVLGIILGPVALTTALILLTAAKSMSSQTDLSMNAD